MYIILISSNTGERGNTHTHTHILFLRLLNKSLSFGPVVYYTIITPDIGFYLPTFYSSPASGRDQLGIVDIVLHIMCV